MSQKITSAFRWLWSIRNELLLVTIIVLAFTHLAGWLRSVDPTAAPLDIGILSAPAVAMVGVICGVLLFWVLWRFCFPDAIDRWFDSKDGFLHDFFASSPAVRLFCFFGTLWTVLLSIGLITMALR